MAVLRLASGGEHLARQHLVAFRTKRLHDRRHPLARPWSLEGRGIATEPADSVNSQTLTALYEAVPLVQARGCGTASSSFTAQSMAADSIWLGWRSTSVRQRPESAHRDIDTVRREVVWQAHRP